MEVAWGDGKADQVRLETRKPVTLEHRYAAPGAFAVVADGKIMVRGLNTAFPLPGGCPGVCHAGARRQRLSGGAGQSSTGASDRACGPRPRGRSAGRGGPTGGIACSHTGTSAVGRARRTGGAG
jgi:hypothetical protein